jgi:hypothetical protein
LSVTKNLEFSKGGGHGNSDPSRAAEATARVHPFDAKALAMTERFLQEFFDTLRSAQQANRVMFAEWYDIIERIDRCFVRAGKNLINPKPVMTGTFYCDASTPLRRRRGWRWRDRSSKPS